MFTRISIILGVIGALIQPAAALTSDQIVVLVNANEPESVALGRFYCSRRNVPQNNLVALDLPTSDSISSEDYDEKLLRPLRKAILRRGLSDRVQCIVTTRGVPFRLLESKRKPQDQLLHDWYVRMEESCQTKLEANLQRLKLVGEHFPAKAAGVTSVDSVGDLFDMKISISEQEASIPALVEAITTLIEQKSLEVHRIDTEASQNIARRQILAISQEIYGVQGLLVAVDLITVPGAPNKTDLDRRRVRAGQQMNEMSSQPQTGDWLKQLEGHLRTIGGVMGVYGYIAPRLAKVNDTSKSAVDSELSLLLYSAYSREGMQPNPLHWKNTQLLDRTTKAGHKVLMVARLDGPSMLVAAKLVQNAMTAETNGLQGRFYVDAGGAPDEKSRPYNSNLNMVATQLRRQTSIVVKMNRDPEVFAADTCPDAALYVGWYSLQNYVPAFTWTPGAVGYHIASWEAMHLRDADSNEWVPQMISRGVAATIGAADEPYLGAFPPPQEFFPLVVSGQLTVCEAYWRSVPHVSWRMMFIGDPLYNPYASKPERVRLMPGMMPTPQMPSQPDAQAQPSMQ